MKKRIISLLLAAAMALALTSCGSGSNKDNSDGRRKLRVGLSSKLNVTDYETNYLTQFIEDKLNADIEFVFFADNNGEKKQQLTTMIAGGEKLPDVLLNFYLGKDDQRIYGDDGYLIDLAPYFDDPTWEPGQRWFDAVHKYGYPEANVEACLYDYRTPQGAMYAWPSPTHGRSYDSINGTISINKVWLDKLGLEMPTTYEELLEVLRAFRTQDPNGNGIADEIPMIGCTAHVYANIAEYIVNTMGTIYENDNQNAFYSMKDNGEIYNARYTEEYREGLRRIRDLVKEGLLAPMTFSMPITDMKGIWTPTSGTAVAGVVAGNVSVHANLEGTEVLREYVPLPPLKDSYVIVTRPTGSRYNFITTDCEDFDLAVEFFMLWCDNLDVFYATNYGKEGVDWEWCTDYETGLRLPYRLNLNAYTGQTRSTWAVSGPTVRASTLDETSLFKSGDPNPPGEKNTLKDYMDNMMDECAAINFAHADLYNPKVTTVAPRFNEEETLENGNKLESLQTYMNQARAQFAVGDLNIDSDADWNNYLKTCRDLGIETLLKNAKAAYERQQK